jgi:hypothetical protein
MLGPLESGRTDSPFSSFSGGHSGGPAKAVITLEDTLSMANNQYLKVISWPNALQINPLDTGVVKRENSYMRTKD